MQEIKVEPEVNLVDARHRNTIFKIQNCYKQIFRFAYCRHFCSLSNQILFFGVV
jgi:hypothetical protein